MKSFYVVLTACAMVAMTSCGQCSKKQTEKADAKAVKAPVAVNMDLSTGYAKASVNKDSMQTVLAIFNSPGGETLYGRLVLPAKKAGNIRFNQISLQDGKKDGPFGREITYDLASAGTDTLSIGESLMQGDPYKGNFTVELYTGVKVAYEMPANYFVKNTVDTSAVKSLKITTKKEFDSLFGMATTMKSKPTPIDFSKQFAIALIGRPTTASDKYEVSALLKKGDTVTLIYRVIKGEKQTFTSRPFLLLTAGKEFDGALRVVEPINF